MSIIGGDTLDRKTNGWISVLSGGKFRLRNPELKSIACEDIARGLSNTCRFGGHVSRYYSVAEHCVNVANRCSPEARRYALLHDAEEAYFGDWPSPLKNMMPPDLLMAAQMARAKIFERFGLKAVPPIHIWEEIKTVDDRMLRTEAEQLGHTPWTWGYWDPLGMPPIYDIELGCMSPEDAYRTFMAEWSFG